jgi:hypothetical protein
LRPYLKKTLHKNRAGGVAQGEDPEFKPQYHKKKKKSKTKKTEFILNCVCPGAGSGMSCLLMLQ